MSEPLSVPSAPPLPSQLTYGRIRWTVIGLDTDTEADLDDLPDVVAINGRAYVTPDVDRDAILGQGLVVPTTILTKRTELLIVNGHLQDKAGNTDVKLLANDSPGINPTGWSYTIEYALDDGYTFGSFSFTLSTNELVDLTEEIPLGTPSPGVIELAGPPGPPGEGYGGGFVIGPLDPTAPTSVQIVSRWGVRDDGSAYYDQNGAASHEAGLLVPDPATGQFTVFRPGGPFSTPFDVQFSDLISDSNSASYGALATRFLPASTNVGVNGQFLTLQDGKPAWVIIPVTQAMHDALAARVTATEGDVDGLQASVSGLSADKASTAYVDDSVSAEALARVNADIDLQGQINANSGNIIGQGNRLTAIETDYITSVEQAAAIDAATALFGRNRGSGTSLPNTDLRRGDVYYHTGLVCLMVYTGAGWRQATRTMVVDIAARDAISTTYSAVLYDGFTVWVETLDKLSTWTGTAWDQVASMRRWLQSSTVSAVNGAVTAIPLNTTDHSRGSGLTISGPAGNTTGGIKVDRTGLYLIDLVTSFGGGTSGARTAIARVNGISVRETGAVSTTVRVSGSWALMLAANDIVDLAVYVEGSAVPISGAATRDTALCVTRLDS